MDRQKKAKLLTYTLWISGFVALIGVGAASSYFKEYPAEKPREPTPQERQASNDLAKAITYARLLKSANKDPDSFRLHSFGLTEKGAACIEYSGTNSFNARIRSSAVLSRDGKIMLTTDDGNKFVSAWNLHCAKQSLQDKLALAESVIARMK